jgi:hypothetical protein
MDRPDYVDLFTVTPDEPACLSPERWSRAAIEDVAGLGGRFIWWGVLGLRLKARPSTERVGGWNIADRGEDWIRLEASSWFLTAHLVIRLDDGHLSIVTFIRYDRPIAALIWVPVTAVHRRLMLGLLRETARRVLRPTPRPRESRAVGESGRVLALVAALITYGCALLGAAGVLDGKRATTWAGGEKRLAASYPKIKVEFVAQGISSRDERGHDHRSRARDLPGFRTVIIEQRR